MRFRPCIDIHNGKVKQIVGGSLRDEGDQAKENFVSTQDAAFFAEMYQKDREENAIWVSIGTSPQILHLIVEKGSICIDGISLTVAKVDETGFQVSVIPHTGEETALLEKVPGDPVNLENDVIGKYVERLLGIQKNEEEKKESGITMEFLEKFGF